jgi:hypothetical protein
MGYPIPGGNKYGEPAPPCWGNIKFEAISSGHESRGTRTREGCAGEAGQQL